LLHLRYAKFCRLRQVDVFDFYPQAVFMFKYAVILIISGDRGKNSNLCGFLQCHPLKNKIIDNDGAK
ncbi:MAG: hypothetical protein NC350_04875, partial [Corallococcus sp.]|nr:hypothetical protein [Corallococcus sp.]